MVPAAAHDHAEPPGCVEAPRKDHKSAHGRAQAAVRAAVQPQRIYGFQGRDEGNLPEPCQLCGGHRRLYRQRKAAAQRGLHLQEKVHQRHCPGAPALAGDQKRRHRRDLSRGALLAVRDDGRAARIPRKIMQAPEGARRDDDLPRTPCEFAVLEPSRPRHQADGGRDDMYLHAGGAG